MKLWRTSDGTQMRMIEGRSGFVHSVAFAPDGEWLASAHGDGTVKRWSVADGSLMRTLRGHTGTVYSVAISPDGQRMVSGSGDRTVKIWQPPW